MSAPSLRGVDFTGIAMLAGLIVAVYLGYELVKHISLFNPASPNNLVNTGFNGFYQDLTGSEGTLGTDLGNIIDPVGNVNASPAVPMCFKRTAAGALVYVDGVIQEVPCAQNPPGWQTP